MKDPFPGVGTAEMKRRIMDARLGIVDTQIALMRLIDGAKYSDIGAACDCDRRTASRHMKDIIKLL